MRVKGLYFSLLLMGILGAAGAQEGLRARLPQDGQIFDLYLRSTDDPELLSPRQAVLRQKLLDLGVDPRRGGRPTLESVFARRMNDRADFDPFGPGRTLALTSVDWEHQTVQVLEMPLAHLFETYPDTNVVGIAFQPARDSVYGHPLIEQGPRKILTQAR